VRRFEQYGLGAHPPVPTEAIAYGLAEAAPIILHLAGDESSEGRLRRYCTSIVEVTGLEEGRVATTELWSLDRAGRLVARMPLDEAHDQRLARAGWDKLQVGALPDDPPTNGHRSVGAVR
jgi:hypothetical protein